MTELSEIDFVLKELPNFVREDDSTKRAEMAQDCVHAIEKFLEGYKKQMEEIVETLDPLY